MARESSVYDFIIAMIIAFMRITRNGSLKSSGNECETSAKVPYLLVLKQIKERGEKQK